MRDYRLRAQRKRKQRESERRQGGVGFDRFLTSFFFSLLCPSSKRKRWTRNEALYGRQSKQPVIFRRAELPESVQRTAENKTQGRERGRERERIAEKVDFRRAKVCRQKSEREREGDREKKRRKRVLWIDRLLGDSRTRLGLGGR